MAGKKKRFADDEFQKRKKHKKSDSVSVDQTGDVEDSEFETAELLSADTIREGMLLLGCVIEVRKNILVMSLPGCLSGQVPLNKISSGFTESLREFSTNRETEEPSLSSIVQVGMLFPCKVTEISRDPTKKKPSIILSIDPKDVNGDLKPSLLYSKMVLYVSIHSIEDHGYVVDVGNNIQGFLPKENLQSPEDTLKIGQVIPTFIQKINSDNKTSVIIQLCALDFEKPFPVVSVEDIKLNSILPGTKIVGDVIEINSPFIHIKYLDFNCCANGLSLGPACTTIKVGKQVQGTVLYVHPITHMIYLTLDLKMSPERFANYFDIRKYSYVENLKYFCSYKKFAYYVISKGILGFFPAKDLPKPVSSVHHNVDPHVSKACVLRYHYMDNLVHLSAKPFFLKEIVFPEDVQIGDIYDAVVTRHVTNGMFVKICLGLNGFIRKLFMSDVYTHSLRMDPVGREVRCRVLSTDGKGKLQLTCRESLVELEDQYILSSYENAQEGQFYKGVIALKNDKYILVLFFNDVKGIVPSSYVSQGSIYFVGQTVLCEVISCNRLQKKLKLSLKTEKSLPPENPTEGNEENGNVSPLVDRSSYPNYDRVPVEATITSIKGSQLNIMMDKIKGRVHITELGSFFPGDFPLRIFSVGEKIQVHVIGEVNKKKKNYLEVTHKNYIPIKECSVSFPPYTYNMTIQPGKELLVFVKKVRATSVLVWISPTRVGVLDYLHFSDDLKEIKSLRRYLKVGKCIDAEILEVNDPDIQLTKIDKFRPQQGDNIIGLIQTYCPEGGLVVDLPFDYTGIVAVTDLTDEYKPVQELYKKFEKCRFVRCHVLDINEAGCCHLSLRKSRILGEKYVPGPNFCPEITKNDIEIGKIMTVFVKGFWDPNMIVTVGRDLIGKIPINACEFPDCQTSQDVMKKYPVGTLVKVIVKEKVEGDRLCCILDIARSGTSGNLTVDEDNTLIV